VYGHHFDDCCAGVLDPNPDPNPKGPQVHVPPGSGSISYRYGFGSRLDRGSLH